MKTKQPLKRPVAKAPAVNKGGRPPRNEPRHKVLLDQKLADTIRIALADQRLNQSQLASYLDMDPSTMARAFQAPHRIRDRVDEIATFLGTSPTDLMQRASEEVPAAPTADAGSLVSRCFPGLDEKGMLGCPPGMAIWLLEANSENCLKGQPVTLLLAPTKVEPNPGELVFAQTKDGRRWLRRFWRDQQDVAKVLLTPHVPGDGALTVREDELEELRVVAGVIRLGGMP